MTKEQYEMLRQKGGYDAMYIDLLNASGFAGCLPNGNIVDRRYHPEAIPIQKNSVFGVSDPKQPSAIDLIAAERQKQISKGYTVEHDAAYVERTGISYSLLADRLLYNGDLPDDCNMDYWIKLRNLPNKRKLAIAGAWIAAELDRIIYEEIKACKHFKL